MDNHEFFEALRMMEEERGIPADVIAQKISTAITVAAKKDFGGQDIVHCEIDPEKETFSVFARKSVVDEVEDPFTELTPDEAARYREGAAAGEEVDIPLDTMRFGRIVAQTAKHVIRQGLREAERGAALEKFQSRTRELVSATVQKVDPETGNALLTIGEERAVLPKTEQVPGEELEPGEIIKVYVVDVKDTEKGARLLLSRTHPGVVKRLFEMEVPEINDGIVEIRSVARQAGSRSKIAVSSRDATLDPVGACIGPHSSRVNKIVEELGGEKIDIVNYSDDPKVFIAEAIKPARAVEVDIVSNEPRVARVTVPDGQLSLAIGNKGQNVRLAVKLTDWKIDIHPESGFYGEEK